MKLKLSLSKGIFIESQKRQKLFNMKRKEILKQYENLQRKVSIELEYGVFH
jgi:hypothetical protein